MRFFARDERTQGRVGVTEDKYGTGEMIVDDLGRGYIYSVEGAGVPRFIYIFITYFKEVL